MIPPRVLVVEDEQDISGLIKHTLERSGDASVEIVGRGDDEFLHGEITRVAFFDLFHELGHGFSEKISQSLRRAGVTP